MDTTTRPVATADCWIETTVRCKGGRNMDGYYILDHYPTLKAGRDAMDAHRKANPKAFAMLTFMPGCPDE